MNDDIIRMAREAGCEIRNGHIYHPFSLDQMLKRFAALVRADECEACAKAARTAMLGAEWALTERVLRAIRARGQQPSTTCPDCHGIGYDASGQLCACQQNPSFG